MKHTFNHEAELKNVGIESTPVRQAVLHIIGEQSYPIDVTSISTSLEAHDIKADKVTIYRILDLLAEKGLLTRVEFQEGKFRYEVARSDHHHLICLQCGKIDEIEDTWIENLEKEIKEKKTFFVQRHAIEFYGICTDCQDAGDDREKMD